MPVALPVRATTARTSGCSGAEQADDFLALAAVRQDQGDVVGVDHAEVAVDGAGGVEDVGAGAGRVEGAGDLLADVGRLAGAGDGEPACATVGEAGEQIHRPREGVVEAVGDEVEGGSLGADDLAGVVQPVAGGRCGVGVQNLKGHGCLPAWSGVAFLAGPAWRL